MTQFLCQYNKSFFTVYVGDLERHKCKDVTSEKVQERWGDSEIITAKLQKCRLNGWVI